MQIKILALSLILNTIKNYTVLEKLKVFASLESTIINDHVANFQKQHPDIESLVPADIALWQEEAQKAVNLIEHRMALHQVSPVNNANKKSLILPAIITVASGVTVGMSTQHKDTTLAWINGLAGGLAAAGTVWQALRQRANDLLPITEAPKRLERAQALQTYLNNLKHRDGSAPVVTSNHALPENDLETALVNK